VSAPAGERAEAARLLRRIALGSESSDQVLGRRAPSPLVQELVLGSLRHWFSLSEAVDAALHRPMQAKDQDLNALLIVGAYQLRHMRVPDHAAIFETVAACTVLGKPWARGLVNAVLRRLAAGARKAQTDRSFEHPAWLETRLRAEYPDAEAIMAANNQRAPQSLRVNLRRSDPDAYRARLRDAGVDVLPRAAGNGRQGFEPETLTLARPLPAADLPGFTEGIVSIQDAGAQFAAPLLAPLAGERVLDACAAPGGKLFHLAERQPGASYLGVDRSERRLDHVRDEARRLGHSQVALCAGDAVNADWWDGIPFDRVLLDAPCSGTGTLRRHPDIKLLRRPEHVDAAVTLQQRLLENLWHLLAPGGTLLYCTCSILAAENDAVVAAFLERHADAQSHPVELATGRATRHGWQLLPIDPLTDGFYYSRMRKALA
jgi:16S rRNA (cytosine967-C5)-methyltransferase